MIRTEDLIQTLARNVTAVPRHAIGRRIALGMLAGAAISLLLVGEVLGIRPDLRHAMQDFSFWIRWVYTGSLGIGAVLTTAILARPESTRPRRLWLLGVPVWLLMGIAIAEIAHAAPQEWPGMWLGRTWRSCPWMILLLSMPIFAGLLWSFRQFAPTRPRSAGAAAGLAAGACSAVLYCLHCPEVSALFVLTWFSLGIGLASVIGAALGRLLLRW
jgi:hypothetical protein